MTIDEYNMSEFSVVISCRMRNPEVHIKWLHVVLHARFSLSRSHAADIKNLHPIHTPNTRTLRSPAVPTDTGQSALSASIHLELINRWRRTVRSVTTIKRHLKAVLYTLVTAKSWTSTERCSTLDVCGQVRTMLSATPHIVTLLKIIVYY